MCQHTGEVHQRRSYGGTWGARDTAQASGPLMGTRTASVRCQASELYRTTWKGAPDQLHSTEASQTEMLRRLQCCTRLDGK